MTLKEFREATRDEPEYANMCVSLEYAGECVVLDIAKVDSEEHMNGVELYLVAVEETCDKCGHRSFLGVSKEKS